MGRFAEIAAQCPPEDPYRDACVVLAEAYLRARLDPSKENLEAVEKAASRLQSPEK